MTPEQVEALTKLLPLVGSALTALTAALLWVARMLWTASRKLTSIEATLDAQAAAQRSLQDQLRSVHDRSEANRETYDRLSLDVLRQSAEQAHRVELIAQRLEATERETRRELERISDRARKMSGRLHEAVRIPIAPTPPRLPPRRGGKGSE